MSRIAILFDNTVRSETTGFYVRRAFGELVDVEHFLPCEFAALARGDHGRFDLFVAVDDGLNYEIPSALRPSAFWAIDTHVSLDQVLAKARRSDHVFAAQRDGVEQLRQSGVADPLWLPLACDPVLHRPHAVPKELDVAFVGNILPGPREVLLDAVREHFPNCFIGRRYLQEMARTYSATRVAFNRSVANDVNMRVFEALACGTMLVTNDLADNGLNELVEPGRHLVTYRDTAEMLERIAWYLVHDVERERIAAEGCRHVVAHHTYRHRAETILETVDSRHRTSVALPAPRDFEKAPDYFAFARPEVLALIPPTARRVLDIGCGSGRLGEALQRRQPATVVGIELDPVAAAAARTRLDHVLTLDVQTDRPEFGEGEFDAVVCADVLEHLRHPERLLPEIRRWLAPDGCLIASIPNVRHHSVLTSLLAGNFTYETAGLLDETHVRFFTRREIEKLLHRTGFEVRELQSVPGPGDDTHLAAAREGTVEAEGLCIKGLAPDDAAEFSAYQYLVVASPAPDRHDSLTSIVIVTHNQLDYTRLCLDSIRFRTDEPYELIVVDNGSTDGTVDYLRAGRDVRWIENPDNRGFPAAVNQGLAIAQGEQVLLLNNDTVVTTGWLGRLLDALRSDPRHGLVGPVSNNVSGPQQIDVAYRQLADLDGFAWDWGRTHARRTQATDRLVGFCLLIDRRVIDTIGPLDERFGIGNFEDDDYCRRAREAGFRGVIARDAFVHHFGGRTFAASGIDYARLMSENQRKFREKWNGPSASDQPGMNAERGGKGAIDFERAAHERLCAAPASGADGPGEAGFQAPAGLPGSASRLSLCMIVRDNERTIRPCLESIRPYVDEMIVVDTGSTDRTPDVCRELGAQVFHFPWCDDFSAARNDSLAHATGEWLFWMDSDDTISEACGRQLRALANGHHADHILGYVMQVHCPASDAPHEPDVTVVDHIKLFRNRPDLRFEHRIHEQILPAIRRAGGEVEFTEIHVVHSGSDHTPEGRARKLERDFHLLALDLKERPDHPFVLFNLGMTSADAERHDEAIATLRRCLDVSRPGESHVRKAFALLVGTLTRVGRWAEAEHACDAGRRMFPADKELLFRDALLHTRAGRRKRAEQAYRRILDEPSERGFDSIDRGIGGAKARHNLALLYETQERWSDAEREWRAVLALQPASGTAWLSLADLLLRESRFDEAAALLDRIPQQDGLETERLLIASRLSEARDEPQTARDLLEAAMADAPHNPQLLGELCRLLFERFDPRDARRPLERLAALDPGDAAARHNLGTVQRLLERPAQAVRHFRRSLQRRPLSPATSLRLSEALLACGRTAAARDALRTGLHLSPESPELRSAWDHLGPQGMDPAEPHPNRQAA